MNWPGSGPPGSSPNSPSLRAPDPPSSPRPRPPGAVSAQVEGGLRHLRRTRLHSGDRVLDIPVSGLVVAVTDRGMGVLEAGDGAAQGREPGDLRLVRAG